MIGHFLQKLHQGLDPARSMMNKGGGGGSSTPYYAQQDRLFGTQADIAQNLYNQYAAMAPTFLANTTNMVDDAMDGTLAMQMRERAGNDAAAANGASWGAMNRNMQRMGGGFSTDRMLSEANKNSVMGAANMSGALNNATQAAEDAKWNRNAGAYGQIAGMGTGAMQGMGSAASGYGNMANSANINQMANAQGFGKFGSAIAGIGMGYAKGGYIDGQFKRHYADGGDVQPVVVLPPPEPDIQSAPAASRFVNALQQIDSTASAAPSGYNIMGRVMGMIRGLDRQDAPAETTTAPSSGLPFIRRANGGEVKPGLKLASGSYVRTPFVNHLKPVDWRNQPTSGPGFTGTSTGDALGMMAMGMVPGLGMLAVKDLLKGDKSTIRGWTKDLLKDDPKPEVQIDKPDLAALTENVQVQPEVVLPDLTSQWSNAFGEGNYARGGPVKRGLRLASGGYAQTFDGDYETDPDRFKRQGPSATDLAAQRLGNSAMGAATNPMTYINASSKLDKLNAARQAQEGLADAQSAYDATLAAQPVADAAGTAADAATGTADTINAAVDLANAGEAADAASKAADGVGGGNPVGSVIKLGADLASGRDAGEAVADAALGYGGAEAGAALGTAVLPGVGTVVGGVLGGLLGGSIFKDGGKVSKPGLRQGRKNLKPGGKVKGPGSETSDDIPAWLSDGEYVLNKPAVDAVGKSRLESINRIGLKVRSGHATPEEAKAKARRVVGLGMAKDGKA